MAQSHARTLNANLTSSKWSADEQAYMEELYTRSAYHDRRFLAVPEEEQILIYNQQHAKEVMFLYKHKKYLRRYVSTSISEHGFNIINKFAGPHAPAPDLFFTPNTFSLGAMRPLQNELFNIYSIALDVDYKKHGAGNRQADPECYFWDMIAPLCDSVIPVPSYIEVGHQLRLIYILFHPIRANNKKMVHCAKSTLRRLSDALNQELACGCEAQKLASYYRVPNSVNTKDGSIVHVIAISDERYTIQEIMDEHLPDLPDWYASWSQRKGKKKTKLHNPFVLWSDRIAALEEIQNNSNINRENTCFLYAQAMLWLYPGITHDEVMEKVYAFNAGLVTPLLEKELRSSLHAMHVSTPYMFKNSTLSDFVGVPLNLPEHQNAREEERAKRIEAGDMRWQKTQAKVQEVKKMKEDGMTNREIADFLGISIRQVQRLAAKPTLE